MTREQWLKKEQERMLAFKKIMSVKEETKNPYPKNSADFSKYVKNGGRW